MIIFYILSEIFLLKRKGLSDARVTSITKKEYGFAVQFLYRFIKSWKSISDELLNGICWYSRVFEIFINFYNEIVCRTWSNIFWNSKNNIV